VSQRRGLRRSEVIVLAHYPYRLTIVNANANIRGSMRSRVVRVYLS